MNFLVSHAMCALLPTTGDLPGLGASGALDYVRQLRRESSWTFWLGILGGALVFVVTPLLTLGIPLPSFLLPAALLDRHADRVSRTPFYLLRQAVFLLKMGAGMGWGVDPEVRARFALAPLPPDPGTWRAE